MIGEVLMKEIALIREVVSRRELFYLIEPVIEKREGVFQIKETLVISPAMSLIEIMISPAMSLIGIVIRVVSAGNIQRFFFSKITIVTKIINNREVVIKKIN